MVLEYLFSNYGKVLSEEIIQRKSESLNISFKPADPMVTLFRPIEKLQKLATVARILYLLAQVLDFGLILIQSTREFEKGLSN